MKEKFYLILALFMVICGVACEYNTIRPEPIEKPDPNVDISFKELVYPLFNGCITCHGAAGGVDLSDVEKAYTSLQKDSKSLIPQDTNNESPLVTKLKGGHGNNTLMPVDFLNIELWIDQGAKNN